MEGIAYGSELILETLRANGYAPDELILAGGATRSELWMQIHADVANLPLTLTKVPDAPLLGCAILAAVGTSAHGTIEEAADAMVKIERQIEPDPKAHAAYRPFYQSYKKPRRRPQGRSRGERFITRPAARRNPGTNAISIS
jgi:ribulose kinase